MSLNLQPEPQDSLTVPQESQDKPPVSGNLLFESIQSPIDFVLTPEDENSGLPPLQDEKKVLLESGKRLSECMLWKLLENYYATLGTSAWDEQTPHFITNSNIIAEAYAESIIAFLEEHLPVIQKDEPVYIVEMATGVGRFSFLLLKELEKKREYFPHLKEIKFRYIMTDFTQNNIDYWVNHKKFMPFIEKGWLDFARFYPEAEQSLHLQHSDEIIDASKVKNPLIAIANYFFDTIRHDVFRVKAGVLHEGLVNLERNLEIASKAAPEVYPFDSLEISYSYQALDNAEYYDEPELNQILQFYCDQYNNASIIFPVGALQVIRNLQVLSNNNLVLLSSDKSFTSVEHMFLLEKHTFAVHSSISFMVNYHAIGRFFENQKGHYFYTDNHSVILQTTCFVLTPREEVCNYNRLRYLFNEKLGPSYAICGMYDLSEAFLFGQQSLTPEEQISVYLTLIRMNRADPTIFARVARKLIKLLEHLTYEQRNDLLRLMQVCWDRFYFYRGEEDLAYLFGEIYYELGLYKNSLHCYEVAAQCYTECEAEYLYGQGCCYEMLNQWDLAKKAYEQALVLDPDYKVCAEALNALNFI